MHPAVHGLVSVVVALFVGFPLALVVSPDPTGVIPIAAGIGLAAILSPFVSRHLRAAETRGAD